MRPGIGWLVVAFIGQTAAQAPQPTAETAAAVIAVEREFAADGAARGWAASFRRTVWRKQPDGTWKWIFDAGCDVSDPTPLPADAEVPTLPTASSGAGSASAAINAVAAVEDRVAADAAGAVGRLLTTMSADARVNRAGERPAIGQPAAADLMRKDAALTFKSLMRESSSSGDLVFTMGEARDQVDGKERLRYYARLWQLRPEGWRLVFDELVPRRTPQG